MQIKPAPVIDPSQSILLMETGEDHLFFGTMNQANRQIEQAWFYKQDSASEEDLAENIFLKHPFLQGSFYQAIISYNYPQSLFVPADFFKQENAATMLENMYGKDGEVMLVTEQIVESEMVNIYHVPANKYEWMNHHFTSAKFWHTYSVGIKNLLMLPGESSQLIIRFSPQKIIFSAFKNNTVQLVQSYDYETPDDVLFHALKITSLLGILQQEVRVTLEGLIDEQSAVYKKLHEYFSHLSFARLPDNIRLHKTFDQSPVHFFSTLFKLAACVS